MPCSRSAASPSTSSARYGKSTLIGRLLYESKLIFEDHLTALEAESKKMGTHKAQKALVFMRLQIGIDIAGDEI